MTSIAAILAAATSAAALTATPPTTRDQLVVSDGGRIITFSTQIARGFEPATSPTGGRIAYVGINGDLYTTNPGAKATRRLTPTPGQEGGPAWSPDGNRIIYTRDGDIYTISATGGTPRRLTTDGEYFTPTYSPDGRRIAYSRASDAFNADIWTMNADGTDKRRLTHTKGTHDVLGEESAPEYSPDGKRIAFMQNKDGDIELYVMNADGTNQRRLTRTKTDDVRPRWSNDGTRLAFVRVYPTKQRVAVIDANGRNLRELRSGGAVDWLGAAPAPVVRPTPPKDACGPHRFSGPQASS